MSRYNLYIGIVVNTTYLSYNKSILVIDKLAVDKTTLKEVPIGFEIVYEVRAKLFVYLILYHFRRTVRIFELEYVVTSLCMSK